MILFSFTPHRLTKTETNTETRTMRHKDTNTENAEKQKHREVHTYRQTCRKDTQLQNIKRIFSEGLLKQGQAKKGNTIHMCIHDSPSSPEVSLSCSSAVLARPLCPFLCPGRRTSERRSARCSQPSQLFKLKLPNPIFQK